MNKINVKFMDFGNYLRFLKTNSFCEDEKNSIKEEIQRLSSDYFNCLTQYILNEKTQETQIKIEHNSLSFFLLSRFPKEYKSKSILEIEENAKKVFEQYGCMFPRKEKESFILEQEILFDFQWYKKRFDEVFLFLQKKPGLFLTEEVPRNELITLLFKELENYRSRLKDFSFRKDIQDLFNLKDQLQELIAISFDVSNFKQFSESFVNGCFNNQILAEIQPKIDKLNQLFCNIQDKDNPTYNFVVKYLKVTFQDLVSKFPASLEEIQNLFKVEQENLNKLIKETEDFNEKTTKNIATQMQILVEIAQILPNYSFSIETEVNQLEYFFEIASVSFNAKDSMEIDDQDKVYSNLERKMVLENLSDRIESAFNKLKEGTLITKELLGLLQAKKEKWKKT